MWQSPIWWTVSLPTISTKIFEHCWIEIYHHLPSQNGMAVWVSYPNSPSCTLWRRGVRSQHNSCRSIRIISHLYRHWWLVVYLSPHRCPHRCPHYVIEIHGHGRTPQIAPPFLGSGGRCWALALTRWGWHGDGNLLPGTIGWCVKKYLKTP